MIFSRETLDRLIEFESKDYYVFSLYLNVNGKFLPRKKHVEQEWDFLLHQAKKEIEFLRDITKEAKNSLDGDLEEITRFVNYEFDRDGFRTLVVFSCSGERLWQTYSLPVVLRSSYTVRKKPYARPLALVLDEYQRFATVVVDRRKARIFSVQLGQIEEHTGVFEDDVPAKVRAGDWAMLREKKILHHIEDHVLRHLKHTADRSLEFFKEREFDRLILAGHEEIVPKFETVLHPYLQERTAGKFYVEPDVSLDEILKQSLSIEEKIEREDEARLLKKLYDLAKPNGRAVVGLKEILEPLMVGRVQMLLIGGEYKATGFICPQRHSISIEASKCRVCGADMKGETEITEDIIEETLSRNGEVEYVFRDDKFAKDGIGAFLRYTV